jgi:hypothetical protein
MAAPSPAPHGAGFVFAPPGGLLHRRKMPRYCYSQFAFRIAFISFELPELKPFREIIDHDSGQNRTH